MNREEFISYIKDPSRLDKKSLPEMNELIQEFPFFQSGHLLFLRNLHNLDHIRLGSQLKRSSVYISNREILYRLLHGVDTASDRMGADHESSVPEPGAEVVDATKRPEKEPSLQEKKEAFSPSQIKDETERTDILGDTIETGDLEARDALLREIRDRLEEIQSEAMEQTPPGANGPGLSAEAPQVDEEFIYGSSGETQAHHTPSFEDHTHTGITESEGGTDDDVLMLDEKWSIETITSVSPDTGHHDLQESRTMELLDLDYPVTREDAVEKQDETPKPDIRSTKPVEILEDPGTDSDAHEKKEDFSESEAQLIQPGEKRTFTSWFDILDHTTHDPDEDHPSKDGIRKRLKIKEQQKLIDDFISIDPKIPPARVQKDTEDISLDSVQEKDGLFTETLARIYIKQGYYSKAIFIYKELSLKFPEKSSYFARQISEIEGRIREL